MRVFETTILIQANGQAVLQLPQGLKPGPCKAVVVLEEPITPATETNTAAPEPLTLPQVPVTNWTGTNSTRREDLYGERGR